MEVSPTLALPVLPAPSVAAELFVAGASSMLSPAFATLTSTRPAHLYLPEKSTCQHGTTQCSEAFSETDTSDRKSFPTPPPLRCSYTHTGIMFFWSRAQASFNSFVHSHGRDRAHSRKTGLTLVLYTAAPCQDVGSDVPRTKRQRSREKTLPSLFAPVRTPSSSTYTVGRCLS